MLDPTGELLLVMVVSSHSLSPCPYVPPDALQQHDKERKVLPDKQRTSSQDPGNICTSLKDEQHVPKQESDPSPVTAAFEESDHDESDEQLPPQVPQEAEAEIRKEASVWLQDLLERQVNKKMSQKQSISTSFPQRRA